MSIQAEIIPVQNAVVSSNGVWGEERADGFKIKVKEEGKRARRLNTLFPNLETAESVRDQIINDGYVR